MLTCADIGVAAIESLVGRYGIEAEWVESGAEIPGSFWGAPEAGIVGIRVCIAPETPVHSLLHEVSHIVCVSPARRATLHTNAGSDDLEESAVCYLQVLLADYLPGAGSDRIVSDMDAWGYSFRLGDTRSWFESDAEDARDWLVRERLLDAAGAPVFRLRGA